MVHYVRKPKLPNTISGMKVTYQSDRITLEKQCADNPFTYGAMWKKIDNMGGKWLSHAVLRQNIEDKGFVILQFYGMSNSGKSWLAFAKAFELRDILIENGFPAPMIHLVHDWSGVLHAISKAQAGDIIFCDEESVLSGQESLTEANSMKNILKACRAKRINFFFIDPDPVAKPNVHAWIYVVAKIKDNFTTMSIIHDAQSTLVGLDFDVLPMGDEAFQDTLDEYEALKMANIEDLLAAEGKVGADFAGKQEKEAQVLLELARAQVKKRGQRMTLKRLKVLMVKHRMTGGTGEYREQITTMVMDEIKDGVQTMDDEHDDSKLVWSKESAGEEILPKDFHKQLTPFLYSWAKKEDIKKEDVDIMLRWFKGVSQDTLAEERGVSQPEMALLFKSINQRILGYACEDWLAARNPHWTHVGGNTSGIDIESDDAVMSIKATSKKTREFTIKETSKAERDKAVETDKEFLGFMFHVRHNRIRKIRWEVKT